MAEIYYAPKPLYSAWEWFKFIALRTAFPPILLWDLLKFGTNKLLGEWVGELVLPAQTEDFDDLKLTENKVITGDKFSLNCKKLTIVTHDKIHLDTYEIQYTTSTQDAPKYEKYIINLIGNGMRYESIIRDMQKDAKALKAHVVGFNFRGVVNSTGKARSSNDLVVDGIAQVQRLIDQGVSPKNITLKGHSLGAGVGSLVAKHFHQLGQPINIFNGRSFSNLSDFLIGHIRLARNARGKAIGHKESVKGIILGWLVYPFVKFGIALVKWEIDAGTAFKHIPEAYRDYVVVRSKKSNRDQRPDDEVIPHYASIHKALTTERQLKKSQLDREIRNIDNILQKTDLLIEPSLLMAKDVLIKAREKIKSDRKMENSHSPCSDGHNVPWDALRNRSGQSAQTFFQEFVYRAEDDHAIQYTLKNQL